MTERMSAFWRGFWDGMGLGPLWRFLGRRAFRAGMVRAAQIAESDEFYGGAVPVAIAAAIRSEAQ